jgi:hypothetical protein
MWNKLGIKLQILNIQTYEEYTKIKKNQKKIVMEIDQLVKNKQLYRSNMEYHIKTSFVKTTLAHTQSTSKIALKNLIQNYDSIQNN